MEDKFSRYFKRFYILIFLIVFSFYAFLAILAPVLMHHGFETPARLIYRGYRLACHQLAYRSFFLYGEQAYYPLPAAGMGDSVITFTEAVYPAEMSYDEAQDFVGNEQMGYKLALCQRDIAIFLSIAFFCLFFFLTKARVPRINLLIWFLLGIAPIALDGFSQMFSGMFPSIFTLRESTPFLRVLTGGCFGFFTAWLLIPYMHEKINS